MFDRCLTELGPIFGPWWTDDSSIAIEESSKQHRSNIEANPKEVRQDSARFIAGFRSLRIVPMTVCV
jgi:hypothetical protein